jgi:hypothetical protein
MPIASERETCPIAQRPGCPMTTSSSSPSLVVVAPPPAEVASPVGSTYGTPKSIVVVVSTSSRVLGVASPCCAYEEDTPTVGSVVVGTPLTSAALVVESGSGARSPSPWAASTIGSWGPLPPEHWDVGVMPRFVALQHASKGQKAWAKSRKKKEKNLQ